MAASERNKAKPKQITLEFQNETLGIDSISELALWAFIIGEREGGRLRHNTQEKCSLWKTELSLLFDLINTR